MTEEEKALAGQLYFAREESIQKERVRSQELSYEYNQLRPSQTEEREAIIRREMKKVGERFRIEAPFYCDFWGRVTLGEDFFANYNFVLLAGNEVIFGDHVLIGPHCTLPAGNHKFDPETGYFSARTTSNNAIVIGEGSWLASGVTVTAGVTLGRCNLVCAGAVVTKSTPDYAILAGAPAKQIGEIDPQTGEYHWFHEKN